MLQWFRCVEVDGRYFLEHDYTVEPVMILQSTFLDWALCFSQPWTGFSFPRFALRFHDRKATFLGRDGQEEVYVGGWKENRRHGPGAMTWSDGSTYVGEWRDGRMHGAGVRSLANGKYEGQWRDGAQHGNGVHTLADGSRYEGEFVAGQRHGRGVYTDTDGARYEGRWHGGKKHGQGVHIDPDGQSRYECSFADGAMLHRTRIAELVTEQKEPDTSRSERSDADADDDEATLLLDPSDLVFDSLFVATGETSRTELSHATDVDRGRIYRGRWRGRPSVIKLKPRGAFDGMNTGGAGDVSPVERLAARRRLQGSRLAAFHGFGRCVVVDFGSPDGDAAELPVVRALDASDDDERASSSSSSLSSWWWFEVHELLGASLHHLIFEKNGADPRMMAAGRHNDAARAAAAAAVWPWSERLRVLRDVAEGMAQLHAMGYTHRDMSSKNILFGVADGRAKVSDLDLAAPWAGLRARSDIDVSLYIAPEDTAKTVGLVTRAHAESPETRRRIAALLEEPEMHRRVAALREAYESGGGGGGGDGSIQALVRAQSRAYAARPPSAGDAYAFGSVMYEVLTLSHPWRSLCTLWERRARGAARYVQWHAAFARNLGAAGPDAADVVELWAATQRGERQHPVAPAYIKTAPAGFETLMRELWAYDPAARPTLAEAQQRLQEMDVVMEEGQAGEREKNQ